MRDETRVKAGTVSDIVDAVEPYLQGNPPEVISVVLSDLIATYLAGWSPHARDDMLAAMIDQARGLLDLKELMKFGAAGHPDRTRGGRP